MNQKKTRGAEDNNEEAKNEPRISWSQKAEEQDKELDQDAKKNLVRSTIKGKLKQDEKQS
eukprot:CAMPEP_0170452264 /NCGR_PEP_ID=MMETSP0123-20130129/1217_1 /TAXON_ID=182087 /ORGANISM="Favella ehrenbergii, Strain Fehren 1" /LENGTH=59 /DNA_ID=CAMNT_0010714205 /DNA_START=622 /DNA_END=801 /DNA_ORIENTATION=+